MTEREYRNEVKKSLSRIYEEVESPWYPFRECGRRIYSPAIDIAVGPFAIENRYEDQYTRLLNQTREFIEKLIGFHNRNIDEEHIDVRTSSFINILHFNDNARCLMGIEIENTGSRKHCIGDLVNAAALGRVGVLIAWSPEILRAFLRQRAYLEFLFRVGKNTFKTDNALILTRQQFDECLNTTQIA
jgi:hypothetical protein